MAVDLSNNLISDIAPLLKLKNQNLKVLYISQNKIPCEDISRLRAKLRGVMTLGLDSSNCVDESKPLPEPEPRPRPQARA